MKMYLDCYFHHLLCVIWLPVTSSYLVNLIVGGQKSTDTKWPWHARLTYEGTTICGGALIGDRVVITAAHCVQPYRSYELEVTLGSISRHRKLKTAQTIVVKSIIVHPGYNDQLLGKSDVALLILAKPYKKTRWVKAISLPNFGQKFDGNKSCYATGFGHQGKGTSLSDTLLEAKMPAISNKVCKRSFSKGAITRQHICVYSLGKSTCLYDSGGPVHCNVNGAWILVGITSWGPVDCSDAPSVNMRVSKMLKFIYREMRRI